MQPIFCTSSRRHADVFGHTEHEQERRKFWRSWERAKLVLINSECDCISLLRLVTRDTLGSTRLCSSRVPDVWVIWLSTTRTKSFDRTHHQVIPHHFISISRPLQNYMTATLCQYTPTTRSSIGAIYQRTQSFWLTPKRSSRRCAPDILS